MKEEMENEEQREIKWKIALRRSTVAKLINSKRLMKFRK